MVLPMVNREAQYIRQCWELQSMEKYLKNKDWNISEFSVNKHPNAAFVKQNMRSIYQKMHLPKTCTEALGI